jgi:hypothetical protein
MECMAGRWAAVTWEVRSKRVRCIRPTPENLELLSRAFQVLHRLYTFARGASGTLGMLGEIVRIIKARSASLLVRPA